jgi:hypothetical protein
VAVKATYDALGRTPLRSPRRVPLRDGPLLPLVHELLQARVGLDLALTDADERGSITPLRQYQLAG